MKSIIELKDIVAKLRAPGGCPWDQEQTHHSLAECLIEETCELLETIDNQDMDHMREELGDVLLQVIFHAQLAEERSFFNLEDVAREICDKLIRRHPHVFGDTKIETTEELFVQWEAIKKAEKAAKQDESDSSEPAFKPVPPQMPALLFARDIFKQIDKRGYGPNSGIELEKIDSIAAQSDEDNIGKQLFELAAASRKAGIDPESALRRYTSNLMAHIESQQS